MPYGTEVGLSPGDIVLDGRASFIAVFAIPCTRYHISRPMGSCLMLNNARQCHSWFISGFDKTRSAF